MNGTLNNIDGDRGESLAFLALTSYRDSAKPLFRIAHLGEKWPVLDYYAELESRKRPIPIAGFQIKSTSQGIRSRSLPIQLGKTHTKIMAKLPMPVYVIGVDLKTRKSYVRAVTNGKRGISSIPTRYQLTSRNLHALHDEIEEYWQTNTLQKIQSKFI
jgi:hypothetical protein